MCTVCGCGSDEVKVEGDSNYEHEHTHDHGHHHSGHHYLHQNDANIDFGTGPAGAHVAGISQQRMVRIEQDILAKNDRYAEQNRSKFAELGLFVINLVSSPGSGKTTLLTETIKALKERLPITVIEGDQQTANDAERIRATGVPALQINTGKGCHLDAHMVGHALEKLKPAPGSLLMIENVGNLVCPAAFDLGEAHKVAILSVTEGEDKPLKYPNMFHAADLMLLNKIDLLPHIDFDIEKCIEYARCVNPNIQIMQLSATTGDGMTSWLEWVKAGMRSAQSNRGDAVTPPKECNHQLEDEVATIGAQLEGYS